MVVCVFVGGWGVGVGVEQSVTASNQREPFQFLTSKLEFDNKTPSLKPGINIERIF